jgi:drug/metabolite transporter (DMT)-like permease
VVTTLEPVVAGTVAFAVFGERLGALGWAGRAVVVAAAGVAARASDA